MYRFKEYIHEAVTIDYSGFTNAFLKYLKEIDTFFVKLGFPAPTAKVKLVNAKMAINTPTLKTQPTFYNNGVVLMRNDYYGNLINGSDTTHLLVYECAKNVATMNNKKMDMKTLENFAIACQVSFCKNRKILLPQILKSPYMITLKKDATRDYQGAWLNPKKYIDSVKIVAPTPIGIPK